MMKNIIIQLFSFILPITVLVIVPLLIEKDRVVHVGFRLFCGIVLMAIGS